MPATQARAGLSGLASAAVPPKRMNREEFFAKLAGLDEDRISKALWNLYWRGPAQMGERIQSEPDPAQDAARKRAAAEPPDPDTVLFEGFHVPPLAPAGGLIGRRPRRPP